MRFAWTCTGSFAAGTRLRKAKLCFRLCPLRPSPAAAAAEEKRRIRNRLMESRNSIAVPDIVKIANGNILEEQIRDISECKPVPVAVYRILDAALDKLADK